jgi:hypothetical protein
VSSAVKLNLTSVASARETDARLVIKNIIEWLKTNVGPGGKYNPSDVDRCKWCYSFSTSNQTLLLTFKDVRHAVAFKLAWA